MTHVLLTYPGLIPSVLLCGQYQFTELARQGKIEFRSIPRVALTAEDCGWADVVCMVRSDSELDVAFAKKWKQAGKKLVYVMDDDLLHVPEHFSSGPYYARRDVQANIRTLLSRCDIFLSPSEILREKYGAGKSAAIEEPSPRHPKKVTRTDGPARIGFAGSIDRADDLDALLSTVVKTLLARYGDQITIEFFGAHPRVADDCHLRCIPYCDSYEAYQQTMENLDWDIGLAPMPDTAFHACKHYNKFVEYAGLGIAGVYSDTMPYTRIINRGENGLLCANTPEAWIAAVSNLIEKTTLRENISRCAQHQAETELSVEATALALESALGNTLSCTAMSYAPISIPVSLRAKIELLRGWNALKRYGLRLPSVAVEKLKKSNSEKRV